MSVSPTFKKAIEARLHEMAVQDPLFAKSYQKENKSVEECCKYIISEVQKSGCNGFSDGEIYGMAIHYYDEDDIQVGAAANCKVVALVTM